MTRLGMSEDELVVLKGFLFSALDRGCVPDWELEALLGCARNEIGALLEDGLRVGGHPDGALIDKLVVLLGALAGSTQLAGPDGCEDLGLLEGLLGRLLGSAADLPGPAHVSPPELKSAIKLRVPQRPAVPNKRPA